MGQRWQACTNTTDAQCVSCPNLRAIKGRFGDNEEYVISDVNEECQTACRDGHFRAADGLCRRCSTRLEALELALSTLSNKAGFYRFSACNASANAVAYECDAVEGSEATAHASDFGLDCPRTCAAGWYVERGERASGAAALRRLERRRARSGRFCWCLLNTTRPKIYFMRRPSAALLGCAL